MILLFKYRNHKAVADITKADIEQFIVFIKTVHKAGRAKCRSVASACVFFYKQVIKMPFVLPGALVPAKAIYTVQYHEPAGGKAVVCSTPYFKRILCYRFTLWQRPAHKRSSRFVHTRYRECR